VPIRVIRVIRVLFLFVSLLNILAIAVALAMDAFAVAVAAGISLKQVSMRQTFRLSWHFGIFQAFMPVIGWGAGVSVRDLIEHSDHWVAFGLLALVGGHMLKEAFDHEEEERQKKDPTKGWTLLMLSVATSIDALAVGFSMSMLNISIVSPAIIIGITAAFFTVCGLHIGKHVGANSHVSLYAEITGGLVLLLIGLKILYEHGVLDFLLK
jgi:putative Mn2+ efflux pump MntP